MVQAIKFRLADGEQTIIIISTVSIKDTIILYELREDKIAEATIQGCFFNGVYMKKNKKDNFKLCMIYHCKECPRSRKCEEEEKNYERRKIKQQSNHILSGIR